MSLDEVLKFIQFVTISISDNIGEMSSKRTLASGKGNSFKQSVKQRDRHQKKLNFNESFFSSGESQKFKTHKLERTSSHNPINLCDHCEHHHSQECCMYVFDDFSDILQYAFFKKELDEPYYVNSDDEDFDMSIGNSTPKHFPRFTLNDPDDIRLFHYEQHQRNAFFNQIHLPFAIPVFQKPPQFFEPYHPGFMGQWFICPSITQHYIAGGVRQPAIPIHVEYTFVHFPPPLSFVIPQLMNQITHH